MKNVYYKNLCLAGIIFALFFSCILCLNNYCFASENDVTLTYEKLTKQYPSMEEYIAKARRSVKEHWYPSSASFEHSATIVLRINKEGKLLETDISSSSGDKGFDDSLIDAARKTSFSPLPEDVKEEFLDIDMSFKMQKRNIFLKK